MAGATAAAREDLGRRMTSTSRGNLVSCRITQALWRTCLADCLNPRLQVLYNRIGKYLRCPLISGPGKRGQVTASDHEHVHGVQTLLNVRVCEPTILENLIDRNRRVENCVCRILLSDYVTVRSLLRFHTVRYLGEEELPHS